MMSQFTAPVRRAGGGLDVYTGLLFVALVVLAVGVALLALRNIEHSDHDGTGGGALKLVQSR